MCHPSISQKIYKDSFIFHNIYFSCYLFQFYYIYNTWKILISRNFCILHKHLLVYEKREGKELGITSN
jgi:hypothetical protein